MQVNEITTVLEKAAPLAYQENYDNAGLQVGDGNNEVTGALLCLDVTEDVIKEAVSLDINLIISHHPVIFGGLKKLINATYPERIVQLAIKNDISIYSSHTNLDAVHQGVNYRIAQKLKLKNVRMLKQAGGQLKKVVVFVPNDYAMKVREAMFNAGAGHIGNYESCSFNLQGEGSFKGGEGTNPFVGIKGELHFENEIRTETIVPAVSLNKVITAMINAHPYQEVAYDIYPLENTYSHVGMGVIGELPEENDTAGFLRSLKNIFNVDGIRHTNVCRETIKTVALCGGSGSFLLPNAIKAGADVFISADFKYHQFFDADNEIIIADIGHYESEQFTLEIFYDLIKEKFPTFAVRLTTVNTNPINYL